MTLKQKLRRKKILSCVLLSTFFGLMSSVQAQEITQLNGLLNYPLSNSLVLHGFGNNPSEMDRLNVFMNRLLNDSTIQISNIQITGYSSPDGPYKDNEQLARERAINLKEYLDKAFSLSTRDTIMMNFIAEDWEGLQRQLSTVDYPYNKNIFKIINGVSDSEKREKKIKRLWHGRVYRDLCYNYFPLLRRVEVNVKYTQNDTIAVKLKKQGSYSVSQPAEQEEKPEELLIRTQRQSRMYQNDWTRNHREQMYSQDARYSYSLFHQPSDFFPRIAVKTNLLAFAGINSDFSYTTFIPNLGVEIYFKKKWSVELSMAYSNWPYRSDKRFQGISAYTLEPRYWLKSDGTFKGFFAGMYVQLGDYNLQEHHDLLATEGNRTGNYHSEGISLGYFQPIFNRLSAEVSIRIGYRHSKVKEYRRDVDLNQYKYSHNQDEFDITGSRLNLVYRF